MEPLSRQGMRGWHEVHAAHGNRQDVRVTMGDRTFEGPVVEIANDCFTIDKRGLRTTFYWPSVDAVEVLDEHGRTLREVAGLA
jgi:hypothetical protein